MLTYIAKRVLSMLPLLVAISAFAFVVVRIAPGGPFDKERLSIEDAVKSITDRRIQIQFAADGQWLAADKANAPIRREFQLSPDRPFSG